MDIEMDFADRVLLRKTHDNDQPLKDDIHKLSLEPLNEPTRGAFLSGWITEGKFLGKLTESLRSPLLAVTVSSGVQQSITIILRCHRDIPARAILKDTPYNLRLNNRRKLAIR
jgi:hypothetical protein